jgi:hypothetical protein
MFLIAAQISAFILLAAVLWGLRDLSDLAPYRWVLLHDYARTVLLFLGVLYANLVALVYSVGRLLTLGHTGQRLQHLEKQLQTRDTSVNPELTERLP